MLMNLVVEAIKLENENTNPLHVVADYLEEYGKDIRERHHYIHILRHQKPTMMDYLSIIDKFGIHREKKMSQRVRREIIKKLGRGYQKKKQNLSLRNIFILHPVPEQAYKVVKDEVLKQLELAIEYISKSF